MPDRFRIVVEPHESEFLFPHRYIVEYLGDANGEGSYGGRSHVVLKNHIIDLLEFKDDDFSVKEMFTSTYLVSFISGEQAILFKIICSGDCF